MTRFRWYHCLAGLILLVSNAYAKPSQIEPIVDNSTSWLPTRYAQVDIVFSGMVRNEEGMRYGYFFQIQRDDKKYHARATLINAQTKEVLIYEDSEALIEEPELNHWQVGANFLRFNPINNSWVFGVKKKDKLGFNFKVDLLDKSDHIPSAQNLRDGIELLVNQTSQLNGHIRTVATDNEQFVTAPHAWLRQLWVSKQQKSKHEVTGVLCRFDDGSGFYSMKMREQDALRGSVAGWRNELGETISMSQFVDVSDADSGDWKILIASPKLSFMLHNLLPAEKTFIAGLVNKPAAGFCTIDHDEISQEDAVG